MTSIDHLRYPIGKFVPQESYSQDDIKHFIEKIESTPAKIESAVKSLTPAQLDTPYREGGWTARQVIHHLPDSHLNAYIRLKWTLTEETPTIKAYDEKAWAETPDAKLDPVISVALLKTLHVKWVLLLQQLPFDVMQKSFLHPETGKYVSLARQVATYAWHGEHHLGHIHIVAQKK